MTRKRAMPKQRHYRCTRCHSLIPTGYTRCGNCNYNPAKVADFIERAKRMFPGSQEL